MEEKIYCKGYKAQKAAKIKNMEYRTHEIVKRSELSVFRDVGLLSVAEKSQMNNRN